MALHSLIFLLTDHLIHLKLMTSKMIRNLNIGIIIHCYNSWPKISVDCSLLNIIKVFLNHFYVQLTKHLRTLLYMHIRLINTSDYVKGKCTKIFLWQTLIKSK